ncbi:MAG: tetratricopeptide repeat protein [Actinomycetia bacterium]|nr:tetratricopeptide repeat protein [Actinomycetes bacterium]
MSNLAVRLAETGHRDQALTTAEEATTLYRNLVSQNPAAHTPDLAMALNNLATRLADTGHRDQALTTAHEATTLYRNLVKQNPAAHTPNLARSLNNLATRLADTGHPEQALTTAHEATTLYRNLVKQNPAAHTPNLARSLNNLATRLADTGHPEQALTTAHEATHLRRDLASQNPTAYTPDLARSLSNLATRLADTGHRDQALTTAQEVTRLYRDLVVASPLVFIDDLMSSLIRLARRMVERGDSKGAAGVFVEGLDRFSPASRALILLARAEWRDDNPGPDLREAAQEADQDDEPMLLGRARRAVASAIRHAQIDLRGLPAWATLVIDDEEARLQAWLNCESPAERADLLEATWSQPTTADCTRLSAVADLYPEMPSLRQLADRVDEVAQSGIASVVRRLRLSAWAQTLATEWMAAHEAGKGSHYLTEHTTTPGHDVPVWERDLGDDEVRDAVAQAVAATQSEHVARILLGILEVARLAAPDLAYAVYESPEDAEDALRLLCEDHNWQAMLAALAIRPEVTGSYGRMATALALAAQDDLDSAADLVEPVWMGQPVERAAFSGLLDHALLDPACPPGFKELRTCLQELDSKPKNTEST